jgi:pimeloyl-ACP methyl ester carboxylesterase
MVELKDATEPPRNLPRRFGRWLLHLYLAAGVATFAGILFGYQASGIENATLRGDDTVKVTRSNGFITFSPTQVSPKVGLLFFPGALVDPDAYAPLAHAVATQGYRVTIVRLPLRLAATEGSVAAVIDAARRAIQQDASVRHWVLAGHSKGGKIAAHAVRRYPGLASALVLIGTSHPDSRNSLAAYPGPVMKIYGTRDGLASTDEVLANRPYLPAHTEWVRVDGGNHAQFAAYRFQLGDSAATISRPAQQAILMRALLRTLHRIGP